MAPIPLSQAIPVTGPASSDNAQVAPSQPSPTKKRKRKDKDASQPHILQQSTFRKPTWSYLHLSLVTPETASLPAPANPSPPQSTDISPLTILPLLTAPLTSYLGTTGAAIPLDILKTSGRDVWIRVQRQDAKAFRASLSGWIGSAAREHVPGVEMDEGGGRVRVAWRVVGEGGTVLGLGGAGEGVFGG